MPGKASGWTGRRARGDRHRLLQDPDDPTADTTQNGAVDAGGLGDYGPWFVVWVFRRWRRKVGPSSCDGRWGSLGIRPGKGSRGFRRFQQNWGRPGTLQVRPGKGSQRTIGSGYSGAVRGPLRSALVRAASTPLVPAHSGASRGPSSPPDPISKSMGEGVSPEIGPRCSPNVW